VFEEGAGEAVVRVMRGRMAEKRRAERMIADDLFFSFGGDDFAFAGRMDKAVGRTAVCVCVEGFVVRSSSDRQTLDVIIAITVVLDTVTSSPFLSLRNHDRPKLHRQRMQELQQRSSEPDSGPSTIFNSGRPLLNPAQEAPSRHALPPVI
jgi:hypothetical protein